MTGRDRDCPGHTLAAGRAVESTIIRKTPFTLKSMTVLFTRFHDGRFKSFIVGRDRMSPGRVLPNDGRAGLDGQFPGLESEIADRYRNAL